MRPADVPRRCRVPGPFRPPRLVQRFRPRPRGGGPRPGSSLAGAGGDPRAAGGRSRVVPVRPGGGCRRRLSLGTGHLGVLTACWVRAELGAAPDRGATRMYCTYLAEWRMHFADEMLRARGSSVAQVAERVGYQTEAAFRRAFRRVRGLGPGDLRRRAQLLTQNARCRKRSCHETEHSLPAVSASSRRRIRKTAPLPDSIERPLAVYENVAALFCTPLRCTAFDCYRTVARTL